MQFRNGVLDYGTAPEIYVDGVERVMVPSPGIVRVTLFTPYEAKGRVELRTALHLLWDRGRFLEMQEVYNRARAAVALANGCQMDRR
jgi:hypothetical protein